MKIQIEGYGTKHPTADGRTLVFGYGIIDCLATIGFHFKNDSKDLPTDVLELKLLVTDESGTQWQTSSRFTAGVLIEKMVDHLNGEQPRRICDSMPQFQGEPFLKDVVFSTDSRQHHQLAIFDEDDAETFLIQFKYSSISMDLFNSNDHLADFGLLKTFSVRVNSGFYDRETGDIGVFGFSIPVSSLLASNTAIYCGVDGYDRFIDSALPQPLVFESLETGLQPQSSVQVVHNAG